MQFNIEEELKKLPAKPGVYLMHDEKDAIIYVGKAISLKKPRPPILPVEPQQRTKNRANGHPHRPLRIHHHR